LRREEIKMEIIVCKYFNYLEIYFSPSLVYMESKGINKIQFDLFSVLQKLSELENKLRCDK